MSSFQFPANPSDGDIVVRGNLQAFYNAATNTWRVSEVPTAPGIPGPPGPPGPIGPEGRGVEISGAVDTFADLPAPNAHQFEFWIVDDTNTLYNSDGITWRDLGGPIQGPQGEHGEDGTDGTNGQNGRGWYDTNIIDERPTNYQVQFLSNDGLGFTTDNIMGPQGETGSLQVATATTLGGIKIGRGLDIAPDGTASAGVTDVNFETTPVPPGMTKVFEPIYIDNVTQVKTDTFMVESQMDWTNLTIETPFPTGANRAMIWWFNPSTLTGVKEGFNGAAIANGATLIVYRTQLYSTVTVEGGYFSGNNSQIYNFANQTLTLVNNPNIDSISGRNTNETSTKIDQLFVPIGTDKLTFNLQQDVQFGKGRLTAGAIRLVILPFRDKLGDDAVNGFGSYNAQTEAAAAVPDNTWEIDLPDPPTEAELISEQASELHHAVEDVLDAIERGLQDQYVSEVGKTELLDLRTQVFAVREMPGTPIDILNVLVGLGAQVQAIVQYKFRFEP